MLKMMNIIKKLQINLKKMIKKCFVHFFCVIIISQEMVRWYMKTLQQIEQEYESYHAKTDVVTNLDEFLSFIEIGIDDTKEYQKSYEKELKENHRWQLSAKIRNFFYFVFAEEDETIYDLDSEILRKCILYTRTMGAYYQRIKRIATDSNYLELVKLVDFSSDYYNAQTDYYDYERDQLDLLVRGIDYYHARYEDNGKPFCEFMDKKIRMMEGTLLDEKAPVYVKGRI